MRRRTQYMEFLLSPEAGDAGALIAVKFIPSQGDCKDYFKSRYCKSTVWASRKLKRRSVPKIISLSLSLSLSF
jgi:hypothetical protein